MSSDLKPTHSSLLRFLRLYAARLQADPTDQAQTSLARLRRKSVLAIVRSLSRLSPPALTYDRRAVLFVSGAVDGDSKTARMHRALADAGIRAPLVHHSTVAPPTTPLRAASISVRRARSTFAAVALRHELARRYRLVARDEAMIRGLIEFIRYRRYFFESGLRPLLLSDTSPTVLAMGFAAASAGRPGVWWQDDWHHQHLPPFPVSAAVVKNAELAQRFGRERPATSLFRGAHNVEYAGVSVPTRPRIGVAVNAFFSGSDKEFAVLTKIASTASAVVSLRLHPRTRSFPQLPDGVAARPTGEALSDFVKEVDVVYVGNSASQFELLLRGVATIHVPDLDPGRFDAYGYCERKVVFGTRSVDTTTIDNARDFYTHQHNRAWVVQHTSPESAEGVQPLSELAATLVRLTSQEAGDA